MCFLHMRLIYLWDAFWEKRDMHCGKSNCCNIVYYVVNLKPCPLWHKQKLRYLVNTLCWIVAGVVIKYRLNQTYRYVLLRQVEICFHLNFLKWKESPLPGWLYFKIVFKKLIKKWIYTIGLWKVIKAHRQISKNLCFEK